MTRVDDRLSKDRANQSEFTNEPVNDNMARDEPEQEDGSPGNLSETEAAVHFTGLIRYGRNAIKSPGSRRSHRLKFGFE